MTATRPAAFLLMDSARFIAASLVVLGHARNLLMVDASDRLAGSLYLRAFYFLSGFGHQAVIVFFVLSGYWISRSVHRRIDDDRFWASYLADRLSRLWIVLLPALGLGALLDSIGVHLLHGPAYLLQTGANTMPATVISSLSLPVALGNAAFLQTLVVPVLGSNGPLWSLAFEFWFYLWFPALWLTVRGRPTIALASLAVALFFPWLLWGFAAWMCGALLYAAQCRTKSLSAARSHRLGRIALIVGLLVTLAMLLATRLGRMTAAPADLALAAAFAITLFGLLINFRSTRSADWTARYGAGSSYSLYTIHYPIVALAVSLIAPNERLPITVSATMLVLAITVGAIAAGLIFSMATEANTKRVRALISQRLVAQVPRVRG